MSRKWLSMVSRRKKKMDRPLVILADNDKGFGDYLEKRLSECFVVRSFDDGRGSIGGNM